MKISSNFKDYYDYAWYDYDDIEYKRFINLSEKVMPDKDNYFNQPTYTVPKNIKEKLVKTQLSLQDRIFEDERILIVGDVVYSYIKIDKYHFLYNTYEPDFQIYNENYELVEVRKFFNHTDIKDFFKKSYKDLYKEDIDYILEKCRKERLYNIADYIRKEFGSIPLISYYSSWGGVNLILNPKLKDIIFQSLIPAEYIYQNIVLYLNKINCIEKM